MGVHSESRIFLEEIALNESKPPPVDAVMVLANVSYFSGGINLLIQNIPLAPVNKETNTS
eukprot:7568968-Ditylum_brightwellii.AAC.1